MDIFLGNGAILTLAKEFKVGDMPPDGYLDREEWWNIQKKGGLIQVQCGCGKYCFPQELSIEVNNPVCHECYKGVIK